LKEKEHRSKNARIQGYYTFLLSSIILSLLVVAFPSINFAKGDEINPYVYSTTSSPYGISYQQWTAKFWQWLLSLPASQHPRENYSPEKCANGQQGPVWFLEAPLSGKQERTCTVPAGKSILAAVLQGWCDTSDPTTQTDEDLRKCATEGNDYGVISGTLDGVEIKNLDKYRVDSGFYNVTIVADNLYNEPAGGPYRAFTNGFFFFLEPLPPGNHDLHLSVSVANPINPQYNYAAEWTYHLIVQQQNVTEEGGGGGAATTGNNTTSNNTTSATGGSTQGGNTTSAGGGTNQTASELRMNLEQARTALQNNDTQSAMTYLDMALSAMGEGGGGTQSNITSSGTASG
jgi:hypothetical protein